MQSVAGKTHLPSRPCVSFATLELQLGPQPETPRSALHCEAVPRYVADRGKDPVPGRIDLLSAENGVEPQRLTTRRGGGVEHHELERPAGEALHLVHVEALLEPGVEQAGRGDAV